MRLVRAALAVCILGVILGTAWFSWGQSANLYLIDSLLALMAFSLELASGTNIGFVFLIQSLGRHGWLETLLIANAALLIAGIVRRDKPDARGMLRSLASTSLAVVVSQGAFHLVSGPKLYVPLDLMLAATFCFVANNIFQWNRTVLWTYPYYVVAAAVAALSPVPAVLPMLLFVTWRSYRIYEHRLERHVAESKRVSELHLRTMETLALAIEARDLPLAGRSRRVQIYTAALAQEMSLPESERQALRVASLLYDIGELAIPEHITAKSGPLTEEEHDKIKIHPVVGAEIVGRVKFPYPVAPIVLSHHERWDGNGYPHGLKGTKIPVGARILAAVDTLDALASARNHRDALPFEAALAEVTAGRGSAFDPRVVDLIAQHCRDWEQKVMQVGTEGPFQSIIAAQHEAQVLFDLNAKLGGSLDLEDTFTDLSRSLRRLIPFQTLAIWMEQHGVLTVEYSEGEQADFFYHRRIAFGRGVSGEVARSQQMAVNGSGEREMQALGHRGGPFRHVLSAPFAVRTAEKGGDQPSGRQPRRPEDLRGAITLYASGDRVFTPEEGRILAAVAAKLSDALALGIKYRQAREQAGADPLTGLPNIAALAGRVGCLAEPCAVVVCDLDGFKNVNDQLGHLTGNQLLKALAKDLRQACRESDFVARIGGDEFALLIPDLRAAETERRLEKLRELVRAAGRGVTGSEMLDASFGAAFYPEDGTGLDELLAAADRRMYETKSQHKSEVQALGQKLSDP